MMRSERDMKSGFSVQWTSTARGELNDLILYLSTEWTDREVTRLTRELERVLELLSINPYLFQKTGIDSVRRAVILQLNSLFYHIDQENKTVTILHFFGNRQDPIKF